LHFTACTVSNYSSTLCWPTVIIIIIMFLLYSKYITIQLS